MWDEEWVLECAKGRKALDSVCSSVMCLESLLQFRFRGGEKGDCISPDFSHVEAKAAKMDSSVGSEEEAYLDHISKTNLGHVCFLLNGGGVWIAISVCPCCVYAEPRYVVLP